MGYRGTLGLLLLSCEDVVHIDLFRIIGSVPGVGLTPTLMPMPEGVKITIASYEKMIPKLAETASSFTCEPRPILLGVGCTSFSFALGNDVVKQLVQAGQPQAKVVTMADAVIAAVKAVNIGGKLAVLTPYVRELNEVLLRYLKSNGIHVLLLQQFGIENNQDICKVDKKFLADTAAALVQKAGADGILVSCGALPALAVIEQIEKVTKKPAICSNQAMGWHMLRTAGFDERMSGFG